MEIVEKIKKSNIGFSKIYDDYYRYRNIIYCDNNNKIGVLITARSGCTITAKCFFDMVNLLDDANKVDNKDIHYFRTEYFLRFAQEFDVKQLIEDKYTIIKTIVNPYLRAVSIFRFMSNPQLTFRSFMQKLCNKDFKEFSDINKNHLMQQYIKNEEKYITKYIKIDNNESIDIVLNNGLQFIFDVNKYTSIHHSDRVDHNNFMGDKMLIDIINNNPKNYKNFYDDNIVKLVSLFYKDDIEKYNYSFTDIKS